MGMVEEAPVYKNYSFFVNEFGKIRNIVREFVNQITLGICVAVNIQTGIIFSISICLPTTEGGGVKRLAPKEPHLPKKTYL